LFSISLLDKCSLVPRKKINRAKGKPLQMPNSSEKQLIVFTFEEFHLILQPSLSNLLPPSFTVLERL